jgi:hypothetical protein
MIVLPKRINKCGQTTRQKDMGKKKEGKVIPVHAMKAHKGNGGTAPKKNKKTQYPLNRRLGGPQSQSGYFGGEKSLLLLLEFEPWAIQPVA